MNDIEKIYVAIDQINETDPNKEKWEGKEWPKELIYGQRMSDMLAEYIKKPSVEMKIAARGQHIKRWHIPRSDYPMDRKGYLKWRTMVKLYHGELLSEILKENNYSDDSIEKVVELVTKKKLKSDDDSKALEDIVCLVFLKYYIDDFVTKHDDAKIIDIIQKTWGKMTEKGHKWALQMKYSEKVLALIQQALAG